MEHFIGRLHHPRTGLIRALGHDHLDELFESPARSSRWRTGTIVMGQEVRLGAVSVLHGSFSIEVATRLTVSQPPAFSPGETKVVPETTLQAQEGASRRIEPFPANPAAGRADSLQAKATKAATQFEAILLNLVFGELQRTFSQLPGTTRDGVSKSYDGFGTEALTAGLARRGGIGLGAFITKALIKQANHDARRI